MAVPKFYVFLPVVMEVLSDKKVHRSKDIYEFCSKALNLTDDDLLEKISSGQSRFFNRVGWARTYLKKAGLIYSPVRSSFQLTPLGESAIANGCEHINLDFLKNYASYRDFVGDGTQIVGEAETASRESIEEISPHDQLESAIDKINTSLKDELMCEVMKMSSYEFESLIIKLLVKMGYGSMHNSTTQRSVDEGIDGFVSSDRFGFDSIYTQAKQWKHEAKVSRPEIQKFLGALAGQGADKGVFITTSSFSAGAREFVKKQLNHKIVLIDGDELMNLMLEYNLGVSVQSVYELKKIDYDFFND